MQPILESPRLRLRPVAPDDSAALWALWCDPDVRRYLWDDRVISREEADARVADCPVRVTGRYRYSALGTPTAGQFVISFTDGAPSCVLFSDAPAMCRPVSRGAVLEYRSER